MLQSWSQGPAHPLALPPFRASLWARGGNDWPVERDLRGDFDFRAGRVVFGPVGGILGLIALLRGQILLGFAGIILSAIGFVTALLGIALLTMLFGISLFL
jgi:hypothetical protein